jgi:hypothetical protein
MSMPNRRLKQQLPLAIALGSLGAVGCKPVELSAVKQVTGGQTPAQTEELEGKSLLTCSTQKAGPQDDYTFVKVGKRGQDPANGYLLTIVQTANGKSETPEASAKVWIADSFGKTGGKLSYRGGGETPPSQFKFGSDLKGELTLAGGSAHPVECIGAPESLTSGGGGPPATGTTDGTGPAGTFACPAPDSWKCLDGDSVCGELVPFDRETGKGYRNAPKNGEKEGDLYRSYIRRDVMMLVKYAAASTLCLGKDLKTGLGGDVTLGDMSEKSGAVPGTRDGAPAHPAGTHLNGTDMDIAYFQTKLAGEAWGGSGNHVCTPELPKGQQRELPEPRSTIPNDLIAVCDHLVACGENYHCVEPSDVLDVTRTAIFIAKMHDSPNLRVIGIDGMIGPVVIAEIKRLCAAGTLDGLACSKQGELALKVTFETEDTGKSWFRFHHHHFHISYLPGPAPSGAFALSGGTADPSTLCMRADCAPAATPEDLKTLDLHR